jgi:hypothetical protein
LYGSCVAIGKCSDGKVSNEPATSYMKGIADKTGDQQLGGAGKTTLQKSGGCASNSDCNGGLVCVARSTGSRCEQPPGAFKADDQGGRVNREEGGREGKGSSCAQDTDCQNTLVCGKSRTCQTWEPDHPSAQTPSGLNVGELEAARSLLAKLSVNPLAIKPTEVTPPDQDDPQTTYEYVLPGIGEASQHRWSPKRWDIVLVGQTSPDFFAAPGAATPLDNVGNVQWWRITGGPFAGGFIMRSGRVIVVESKDEVCGGGRPQNNDPIPRVSAECQHN